MYASVCLLPAEVREGIRSHACGGMDGCELPQRCREPNSGLLQDQQVSLPTEPPLYFHKKKNHVCPLNSDAGETAQLCKHEDLSLISSIHVKSQAWLSMSVTSALQDRDRQILSYFEKQYVL